MSRKAITLQQMEEALRDFARWMQNKLAGYMTEPAAEGQSGWVLTTNGAGGRSWGHMPDFSEMPDGSVTTAALADGSVTEGKLAGGSVSSAGLAEAAVTEGKLADGAVTAEKLAAGIVTRDKLAVDALYSPGVTLVTENNALSAEHLGKTIRFSGSASAFDHVFTVTKEVSDTLPLGFEAALLYWYATSVTVAFSGGLNACISGEGSVADAVLNIPERFAMIAIKKITDSDWLVTGSVEVVS